MKSCYLLHTHRQPTMYTVTSFITSSSIIHSFRQSPSCHGLMQCTVRYSEDTVPAKMEGVKRVVTNICGNTSTTNATVPPKRTQPVVAVS
jgi:hypothetical protein